MIQLEKQYHDKLKRFHDIMLAEKGTPEYDESGILADELVEYEEKHFPIEKPK